MNLFGVMEISASALLAERERAEIVALEEHRVRVVQLIEQAKRFPRRLDGNDLVVSPVALAQLRLDAVRGPRVVNKQQNRLQNQAPISEGYRDSSGGGGSRRR